jgi:methionyl aminopeptidase
MKYPNIMNPEDKEKWVKAGKIASEVREWSKTVVKSGAKIVDVANAIENKIRELGAIPGFPVNISLNEVAAHDTAYFNDERVLGDEIIKIDIGVCYEGAIGDTAYTADLSGKRTKLVEASKAALEAATKILKVGVTLGEIGKAIEDTIVEHGFQPIRNLSGHGIAMYNIHTAPGIPNYDTGDQTKLEKGMIIAIEPFATDGTGMIKNKQPISIYEEIAHKPIRSMLARKVAQEIENFEHVPFARRWLDEKIGENKVSLALRLLERNGNITGHAQLVEVDGGMVSQAEHTFLIDDEVVCLTK